MASWGDDDIKYYLLGTPVIYWGSLASVIVLFAMLVVYVIRRERGNVDFLVADQWEDFYFSVKVGVFGWALHYFPFYIMGRVMYVHHYFPALYFGMISFAVLADQCTRKSSTVIKTLIFGVIVMITTANFLYFVDFALGFKGPAKSYSSRRWIKSWNLHD
jgi:dolichyl-phosphate-mannose-protein mannosyltransferase